MRFIHIILALAICVGLSGAIPSQLVALNQLNLSQPFNSQLHGVLNGDEPQDATTVYQSWGKLNKTGDTLSGNLSAGSYWITNLANGTGQQAATVNQMNAAISVNSLTKINKTDLGGFNVREYGASGDGVADDFPSIQAAIEAAHNEYLSTGIKQVVFLPSGIYQGLSTQYTPEILLRPRSGVDLKGAGIGSSIIRAPPAWRNASHGVSLYYGDTEYIDGMTVSDLTFDYGTELFEAGDAFATRIGASHARNVIFDNVEIKNASGSWCIVVGPGSEDYYSSDVVIRNSRFVNSGNSKSGDLTTDFTCIYMNARNASIHDNDFINDGLMTGTACELHNSDIACYHNKVYNITYGFHVGAMKDETSIATGQRCEDNVIRACVGIGINSAYSGDDFSGGLIRGNYIVLLPASAGFLHTGIDTITGYGNITNITIDLNRINGELCPGSTYMSQGIRLQRLISGTIDLNEISNVTRGIGIGASPHMSQIVLDENNILNWGHGFSNGIYTPAIQLELDNLILGGELVINDNTLLGNDYPHYGISMWLQDIARTIITNNVIEGITSGDMYVGGGYSSEKVYINHKSYFGGPGAIYASDGSVWTDYANGIDYRHVSGNWDTINWTYS